MRTVTRDEVEMSRDYVHGMTEDETMSLVQEMCAEQPFLQVYVAAVCDRGDFEDESDMDAFANLSIIVWHAMRKAAGGPLAQVTDEEIERRETRMQKTLDELEGQSEESLLQSTHQWRKTYNQGPLFDFVVELLMAPENEYEVTEEAAGLIVAYIRLIIDCLDQAPLLTKPK